MREPRLGDDIDDFCVRCKRVMNHSIVSVLNGQPAKVRCRTCHSDHDYRHEQAPPPKVDARKAALFNEVLKKVNPNEVVVDVDPEEVPEVEAEVNVDVDVEVEAVEAAIADEAPPADEAPKPALKAKAKAKAKGRARK